MKRLAKPNYDFGDVIDLCIDGIANTQSIKMRITSNKVNLLLDANLYDSAINQGVIYTYSPLIRFHDKMCIRSTKMIMRNYTLSILYLQPKKQE